jgi:DNA adenine methylase
MVSLFNKGHDDEYLYFFAQHISFFMNTPIVRNFLVNVFNKYNEKDPQIRETCETIQDIKLNKSNLPLLQKHLTTLLQYIQKTKNKHLTISEEEYTTLKHNPDKDPLRAAYAAFTYSYNGKFFGGYTSIVHGRDYAQERKDYYDKLHDNEIFKQTTLQHTSYKKYIGVKGKLIYCDPPYENTAEYDSVFNSSTFWEDMRKLSKHNYVFISEYNAPPDFLCITQQGKRQTVSGKGDTRKKQEKVFVHESKLDNPIIKHLLLQTKYKCKSKRETRKVKK